MVLEPGKCYKNIDNDIMYVHDGLIITWMVGSCYIGEVLSSFYQLEYVATEDPDVKNQEWVETTVEEYKNLLEEYKIGNTDHRLKLLEDL